MRQEAGAADLPDLEAVRHRLQHKPKAVPPVPSTRRRCPPRNPRCNEGAEGTPTTTPTPTPVPIRPPRVIPRAASVQENSTPAIANDTTGGGRYDLASATSQSYLTLLSAATNGARPQFDFSLLDFYRNDGGYAVSDFSQPSLLGAAGAYGLAQQAVPPQGIPPAESVAWTNAVGVNASGSALTKVAANGWDAGAMSTKAIASGDGYTEFTVSETSTNRMFGLSHGNSDQSYTDVDFALHTQAGGALYVFEAGVNRGQFGTCATGDRLRVSVTSGVVSYSKNGVTLYTSAVAPRYPLLVDTSLYETGTTLNNALLSGALVENVVWTNVAGVSASGNNLTRGTGGAWNAGASSTRSLAGGDGYVEFTALETTSDRMFGLSRGDSNQDYTDIDFAIYAAGNGQLYLYEAGIYRGNPGAYANGDRLRVSVEGGQVRYRRNGSLLYTSATAPQYPLVIDTSFYGSASTVFNAVISAPLPLQLDPGGTGLTGRYYDNIDFTNFVMTRLDYTVNYDWAGGAPTGSMGVDDFSVRWTGMVVPRYTETYTFYTTTDDGVRLWVDGQLIIDKWQDQAPFEWSGTIALEAGRQYSIRMEFYERAGGALAWLKWSSTSQAKEIIPQSRLLPCWKAVEQFVTDFYQAVLRRAPSSYELQDWTERLTQAQGEAQQIAAAQALGRTLFGPTGMGTEYASLNPSDNHRFVSDLYWGYLQRAPDAGGWSFWEGEVNGHGRGTGIAAFENSGEFKEKVVRLCGTAMSSGTNGGDGYNFAAARLDPSNRTGSGGADPYSRNYNFNIPLMSLAGRAGLDLGLVLSYNSLVWTKDGTGVTFDADRGTPSPGFRLGFPTVQPKFYNPQAQKYAYLLVTPSGARVELRQVGTSNVYEAADSSYLQLTEGGTPTITATDGTQLSFTAAGGEWRCYLVKDRNGNYLSVSYYGDGRIQQVTDTLGRALTFNYDNYQNLLSITQPWRRDTEANPNPTQDETHQWATFGYANVTLLPQFSNLAIIGEQPGTVIPALSQVGLDDGSYYKFSYNQWGQIWKVTQYAADSIGSNGQPNDTHPLTSARIDLPGSDLASASAQTDCPRFTQERAWVENGVMNQSGEVTTSYDAWAPNMSSCQVTLPDGTTRRVRNYFTSADFWKKGLTASEVTTSGGTTVRTATLNWEHDGAANAAAPTNPRVTQTTVFDPQGNSQTTRVTYTTASDFQGAESGFYDTLNLKLPRKVEECADSNCSTVLRTAVTDYKVGNLGQYVARRILGLVRNQYIYEGTESAGSLRAQVGYLYDEPSNLQDTFLVALPSAAAQHDGTNYGTSMTWRGNANRMRRYSVNQTTGAVGAYVENRVAYNVTGTASYRRDASGHTASFSYTDSFFQSINRSNPALQTFAYATTITDPDNFTASTSYNYDMAAVREARTPLPNVTTNQPGPLSRRYYDAAGRLIKSLNVDTGAYTSTVYPAKMDAVQSFTLIETGVESYIAQVLDGAGRTRATARSLPGSVGQYAGQLFDYDVMGRLARQSNPTETNAAAAGWAATGDDAANGWVYTQTTYDWKGRPLVITEPKVNPNDSNEQPATREFEYGGCGCAGGEMVTERGELVPVPGTSDMARRVRRTYSDVLGRAWKSEVLDWSGNVYTTTTTKYDVFDRAVRVRKYTGTAPQPEPSGEGSGYQTTTMAYDGHGRLQSRHLPQQDASAATTYTYNADDTPLTVTDGRGAVTTYTHNARHRLTGLTHTYSGSPTLTVGYQYDAAGNRTRMDDGQGWTTYNYDVLSRMSSETRYFSALGASYTLNYPSYTFTNQLKTLVDPFNAQFYYAYNAAGQVTSLTGSSYANVTTYASNVEYRAWGAVKAATFGNGASQTTAYDGRMRPSQYRLSFGSTSWQRLDYSYNSDDRLRTVTDLDDGPGSNPPSTLHFFSQNLRYDHVGRIVNGGGVAQAPFQQNYGYDAFDNLTSRSGSYGYQSGLSDSATYSNNRRQGWTYDVDGRLTLSPANSSSNRRDWGYDAAGRLATTTETVGSTTDTLTTSYDGDGLVVREAKTGGSAPGTHYMVRSTVLGGEVITRLTAAGAKEITYVQAGRLIKARQSIDTFNNQQVVTWSYRDPSGTSEPGAAIDPLGNYVTVQNPQGGPPFPPMGMYGPSYFGAGSSFGNANNYSTGCTLDGQPWNCNSAQRAIQNGSAAQCPDNNCGPRTVWNPDTGRRELSPVTWNTNTGQLGYWRWEQSRVWEINDNGQRVNPSPGSWNRVFIEASNTASQFFGLGYGGIFMLAVGQQQQQQPPCTFQINIGKSELSKQDLDLVKFGIRYIFERAGLDVKFDTSEGVTSDTGAYTLNIVDKLPKVIPMSDGQIYTVTDDTRKQAAGLTLGRLTPQGGYVAENSGSMMIGKHKEFYGKKGLLVGLGRTGAHESGRFFLNYLNNASGPGLGIMGFANPGDYNDPNAEGNYMFTADQIKQLKSHCK